MNLDMQIDLMEKLTKSFENNIGENKSKVEADFLNIFLPGSMLPYNNPNWFVGDYFELPIGHSAQIKGQGLGFYCLPRVFENYLSSNDVSDIQKQRLRVIFDFWSSHDTKSQIESQINDNLRKVLPVTNIDYFENINEVILPLYRLAGTQLDFDLLLKNGIPGMVDIIKRDVHDSLLCDSMCNVLNTLLSIIDNYILEIQEFLSNQNEMFNKIETLIYSLKELKVSKPKTMHQAIQLIWLYSQCAGSYNYGRLDDYLAGFYYSDIKNGLITSETAIEYFTDFYDNISKRCAVTDGRFTIGGKGRNYEIQADELALLMMETVRRRHCVLPQLTLRFYNHQNPLLMEKAYELIAEGTTFPLLYNDEINISAVSVAFDIGIKDAEQYLPYSCGEYIINHKSIGTPSGTLNVLKALEITLFNGTELISNKDMGIKTGGLASFENFNDLIDAYKAQLSIYIEACAEFQMLEYKVAGEHNSFLLISMLMDDCIEKNIPLLSGGVEYLCGALECYGNTNVADSLSAIKTLVYDKKSISKKDLLCILKNNFVGYESQRQLMISVPKYGNDNIFADKFMVDLHIFLCNKISEAGKRFGMHSFLAVLINNSFNSTFGLITGASPDGRLASTYMANANNPAGGMDNSGVTAMLNSLLKLDPNIHAGYVQNIKLSKNMFLEHSVKTKALFDTYFSQGGTQAMITVINKNDLEDAMVNPRNHSNLLVRVGGFSAKFIDLPIYVQNEIISRTIY